MAVGLWKDFDFLCRKYILNGLVDSLYDVYREIDTAKALWAALDHKYQSEDAGQKKFVVGLFLDFKMVDSKTVPTKGDEPGGPDPATPSRGGNGNSDGKGPLAGGAKANVVEHRQSSKKVKKGKQKLGPRGGVSKGKFQGKCYNCGKIGHKATECKAPKKKKGSEANVVGDVSQKVAEISLSAMVTEVNLVGSNPREWFIDTGATRHLCCNREMFSTFEAVEGEKVWIGNSAQSDVEGLGKVILKMTSGKELTDVAVFAWCDSSKDICVKTKSP
ncbi:uncharacterized protein LOC116001193 [Ipomoea triloba]|uniref:uncharacterized protein LOC116001193 n=1 Tax=Ipomoea triloba TaxID=35885 RepID=UPI00125DC23A|nr:uncharacterized protein LOC116001193 [Ipomoea triloba]